MRQETITDKPAISDSDSRSDSRTEALSALGVFERSFTPEPGYPNALWRSWGYTSGDHEAGLWLLLLHPIDTDRVLRAYSRVLCGDAPQFDENYRILVPDGKWQWVSASGRVISRDSSGRPLRYLGAETDITEQKRAEAELKRAKAEAEQTALESETLRQAGAIVASALEFDAMIKLVLDQTSEVVSYDTASVQLLRDGYLEIVGGNGWANIGEVVGKKFPVPGNNPNTEVLSRKAALRIGNVSERYPEFSSTSAGAIHSWIGAPLVVKGDVVGLLTLDKRQKDFFTEAHVRLASSFAEHVAVAITNSQRYERAQHMAMTDNLTGLATRHAFLIHADALAEQASRYQRPLSILMMDLDHFKRINDEYGHETGDRVLKSVATVAKAALRKADRLCRYGGEELIALLPETGISEAFQIAERIRRNIETTTVPTGGSSVGGSISIGISALNLKTERSVDQALRRADQALYRSKEEGRNRCTVADNDSLV